MPIVFKQFAYAQVSGVATAAFLSLLIIMDATKHPTQSRPNAKKAILPAKLNPYDTKYPRTGIQAVTVPT